MNKSYNQNIIIAGEGGQGIQTIAKALAKVSLENNMYSSYLPSFGVEQRGTPSIAYVIISNHQVSYPRFEHADIIMVLADRALARIKKFITPTTDFLFDSSTINYQKIHSNVVNKYGIPATKTSKCKFNPKSYNVLMYGALIKKLDFNKNYGWNVLKDLLNDKFTNKKIEKDNLNAFEYGYDAVYETHTFSKAEYEVKKNDNLFRNKDKMARVAPSRCKGCGLCIEKCPVGAISYSEDLGVYTTKIVEINLDKCIACGMCHQICPDGAIIVKKSDN